MGDAPKVGDVLRNEGREWIVIDVRTDKNGDTSVTLRPAANRGEDGR
jgi:hypothetical protein